MSAEFNQLRDLFLAAVERYPPDQWEAYLDQACAGNAELRRQVGQLLQAHAREDKDRTGPDGSGQEGPSTVIGPYKLLEPIGEGGMGTVWMARQQEPVKRKVALKLIKAGMDSKQVIARFEAERQALAMMDHPNIAKVFDAGTTDGNLPYFVMELVKGVPITRYCDEHRLTPRQRLELFIPVCQAVQHAHTKGIIHRDLKPSNVLVALYDGKPVPKVIDFGVAKATAGDLTDKTLFTGYGAIVGTLEYMSPEQAELNNLDVDTRSDVYALGVLLYELLTGTTPLERRRLRATSLLEALRLIREEEAIPPSTRLSTAQDLPTLANNRGVEQTKLRGHLRGEVDWIVMKALEKDRTRRYETAAALSRDLERYLTDEPVLACPPTVGYRLRKYARRHKAAFVTGSIILASLLLTVIGLAISTVRIYQSRSDIQHALDRERLSSYWQRIALAERELSRNNLVALDQLLDQCPEELRGWEWHYLKRQRGKVLPPMKHDHSVFGLAMSPDGKQVVTADAGGTVTRWDARTGRLIQRRKEHKLIGAAATYSRDGRWFATYAFDAARKRDNEVFVWDARTGAISHRWKVAPSTIDDLAFGPRGQLACSTTPDAKRGVIDLRDPTDGRVLGVVYDGKDVGQRLTFSDDGKLLAAGSQEGVLRIWDVQTDTVRLLHSFHVREKIWCVAISPDNQFVVAAAGNENQKANNTYLWELPSGRERPPLKHGSRCAAFTPDGKRLATGGIDSTVKIWDPASGQEILTLTGHGDWVERVVFSPDGHRLVSVCEDKTGRIWDATPWQEGEKIGEELFTLHGHSDAVTTVAFHPREPVLATGSVDGTVRTWDTRTGQARHLLTTGLAKVYAVAFTPDGKELAVGGLPGSLIHFFDPLSGKKMRDLPTGVREDEEILQVIFRSDGQQMAYGGGFGVVFVRDPRTGQEVCPPLEGHRWVVYSTAFHPDARRPLLATSDSSDRKIRLWDTTTGQPLPGGVLELSAVSYGVTFSPDGRLLATGSWDRVVRLYETTTWKQVDTWRGASGGVIRVAFSPNGELLAWGATDSTVTVWHRAGGEVVALRGHLDWVPTVAFSPDGTLIASAGQDGTAKIWQTPTFR